MRGARDSAAMIRRVIASLSRLRCSLFQLRGGDQPVLAPPPAASTTLVDVPIQTAPDRLDSATPSSGCAMLSGRRARPRHRVESQENPFFLATSWRAREGDHARSALVTQQSGPPSRRCARVLEVGRWRAQRGSWKW